MVSGAHSEVDHRPPAGAESQVIINFISRFSPYSWALTPELLRWCSAEVFVVVCAALKPGTWFRGFTSLISRNCQSVLRHLVALLSEQVVWHRTHGLGCRALRAMHRTAVAQALAASLPGHSWQQGTESWQLSDNGVQVISLFVHGSKEKFPKM